ncbi:MAG: alginate export family protein [Gammaproteobacteria bacterium]|nr:alginate export family protein [Gammaproteobacteria bacterium]
MRAKITGLFIVILLSTAAAAQSEMSSVNEIPKRPEIHFNRWQEDWSVLANPNVPGEPLDSLKYIPLSVNDPKTYLSLGANIRERYEYNDAMNFGVGQNSPPQSYVISRMEANADLHIANKIQVFVQLESDFAPGKAVILPVDEDRLDVEQAFLAVVQPMGSGLFKFRAGRQQIAFDLQRFVSVRDGPNVRESYDALWGDYELSQWRFITFYSHPVITRNIRAFDDYSSSALTYGGFRLERKIANVGKVATYLSHYKNANANFLTVSGTESRNIFDVRFAGTADSFDWDLEWMGQVGSIANDNIRAWAVGSVSGYTFEGIHWKPRIGIQLDAASGNEDSTGHTLGTFNPLFPNGQYVTLAGYTGYVNFIHLKPSLTLALSPSVTAMGAVAAQWRETTADAVYTQPNVPLKGTAGAGGQYTGTYFQLRIDWQMTRHIHNALEVVRFNVANAIKKVGGKDSTYAGVETKFTW